MIQPPWHMEARVGNDARPMVPSPYSPADHPFRVLAVDVDFSHVAFATIATREAGEALLDFLAEQFNVEVMVMYDRITQEFAGAIYPNKKAASNAQPT